MKGSIAVIVTLLLMLAGTIGVAWWVWKELGDVEIGAHGWYALIAGVVATLVVGVGLMRLVYISHKRGYDERVGEE